MSETSHEIIATHEGIVEKPGLLERVVIGGLREINQRRNNFNVITQYWDPDSGNIIMDVSPNGLKFFEPFQIEVSPEEVAYALIHAESYGPLGATTESIDPVDLDEEQRLEEAA